MFCKMIHVNRSSQNPGQLTRRWSWEQFDTMHESIMRACDDVED